MMKLLINYIIIFLFIITSSCKKENMCDCLKSTGSMETEYRTLGSFDKIELDDNINLLLIQDTVNYIEIEAGKHLMKLIKTEISDNKLWINNKNKCNWVRSYKKEINARLHFRNLYSLIYRGSGDIKCTDTIKSDIIYIENWSGSGIIDLTIKSKESYLKENIGPADFLIKGITGFNYIWSAGYGRMDCRELLSKDAWVNSKGTNDTYINATNSLIVKLDYTGNIYYKGSPGYLKTEINGSGKVVKF